MTLMMFRYVRGHGYHWTSYFIMLSQHILHIPYVSYSFIISAYFSICHQYFMVHLWIFAHPPPLVPHIPPWTTTDLRLEIRHQSPRSLPQDAVAWVRRSHHQWKPLISSKYPARDLVSHNITMIWPSLVSHSYMSHHHPKIDGYPKRC